MFQKAWQTIRHDFGTKLLALLVACALWVYVMNTEDPVRKETFHREVKVVNIPAEMAVARLKPDRARVTMSGRLSELNRARSGGIRVIADASEAKLGHNRTLLRVEGIPERVTSGGVAPPTVELWLDDRISEQIRVAPVTEGKPAGGCEVWGTPDVQPSKIRLSGPKEALDRVARVVAEVDVSGLSGTKRIEVSPKALDDSNAPVLGITHSPEKVVVTVPVTQVTKKLVPVKARYGSAARGYVVAEVTTRPAEITLKGPPDVLRDISEVRTKWIDLRRAQRGRTRSVELVMPGNVSPVDGTRTVSVRIAIRPIPTPPSEPEPSAAEPKPAGSEADAASSTPEAANAADATTPGEESTPTPPSDTPSRDDPPTGGADGRPTRPAGEEVSEPRGPGSTSAGH